MRLRGAKNSRMQDWRTCSDTEPVLGLATASLLSISNFRRTDYELGYQRTSFRITSLEKIHLHPDLRWKTASIYYSNLPPTTVHQQVCDKSIDTMNRYRGPTIGGPSKASATTLCQKCLKRGHYSYECKAVAQERPYVSRPSRTQQLLNPKLVPKLTSDVPQELLRKKGIADEQLAKAELERGRKRERQSEDPETRGGPKRKRSSSSSVSVSTISTDRSGSSANRPAEKEAGRSLRRSMSMSESPIPLHKAQSPSLSQSPQRRATEAEKKRRRTSSPDSYVSEDDRRVSRERGSSRSTRRRFQENSPPARGRRTESRGSYRGRRELSNDQKGAQDSMDHSFDEPKATPQTLRGKSLSPFSKRMALTQSMNMNK